MYVNSRDLMFDTRKMWQLAAKVRIQHRYIVSASNSPFLTRHSLLRTPYPPAPLLLSSIAHVLQKNTTLTVTVDFLPFQSAPIACGGPLSSLRSFHDSVRDTNCNPDITDEQWDEVVARLGDMAASKNRPSASGVRRNEFQLMPIFMQRAGLTTERLATLNFIHVAGTKGKGSTCAMTESILRRCGYRTALYTSPHLVDVRERIRVDGQMLPRSEFAAAFWRVHNSLAAAAAAATAAGSPEAEVGMPSFFYFVTLMAMNALLARPPTTRPHVVVLEVGIGGRLDATNAVVTRGSLAAAAITSLGLDHMEMLGDTLPKIAREKAGIMKAGRPVLAAPQPPDAMDMLKEVAAQVGAPMRVPPPLHTYRYNCPTHPNSHQQTADAKHPSTSPPLASHQPQPPQPSSSSPLLGLGGEHMQVNAALAVALAAEWERQYGTAAVRATAADADGALGPDGRRHDVAAAAGVSAGGQLAGKEDVFLVEEEEKGAVAGGRRVVLLPGRPDPAAALRRAAAVAGGSLPGAYVEGLRSVQWPGRSQVEVDDVAAARGGHLTVYLDGAHTPESMAVCATWFAGEVAAAAARQEGVPAGNSGGSTTTQPCRHVTVLLFNCMKERDPAVLLPALYDTLASATPSSSSPSFPLDSETNVRQRSDVSSTGNRTSSTHLPPRLPPLDAAIFTPMLSGGGVMLPPPGKTATSTAASTTSTVTGTSTAPVPTVDLTWQLRMRDVWSAQLSGTGLHHANDAVGGMAINDANERRGSQGLGRHGALSEVLPSVMVASSLLEALEAVRAAAATDPRVHVHMLVTGSLYLVGDVLRLMGKPPQ